MNLAFRVLLFIALAQLAWGDTVHLKDRGTEINGDVTFSNGNFQIVAQFKKGHRQISIGRDGVSEVRFNNAKDNPDEDAPDWMLHLPTNSTQGQGQDVVKFWDTKQKEVVGTLALVTPDDVTIEGKQSIKKTDVRAIILK